MISVDKPTLEVLYTCHKCGIKDRIVNVSERGSEDLPEWIRYVQELLSRDHDEISPHCKITVFANCKIPLPHGGGAVGKADRH